MTQSEDRHDATVVVDARGMTCPMPLLKAKKALNEAAPGDTVRVLATDPGSMRDFEVFAKQSGHALLAADQTADEFSLLAAQKGRRVKFLDIIGRWVNRYFSNEEAIYLVVFFALIFLVLVYLGGVLAPVLTGLVFAFLLQGLVRRMTALRIPEVIAVSATVLLFMSAVVAAAVFVVPLVWQQMRALVEALPAIITRLNEVAQDVAEAFPEFVTEQQVANWVDLLAGEVGNLSASLLEGAFSQVPSVVGVFIYIILVPISVFFFLKDRAQLTGFFLSLLPKERPLLSAVGNEMNVQLANYVRGKFIEILIVGASTFVVFTILGLNYAALLGVLVGVSVLIPFVGAAVVTIPVALVAIIQFGWSWDLSIVMIAYLVIQALDGNVLVPLLFSEAVDLHPITIIVAVLAFGGLWGLWGVFFAIPLATLVKAVYQAWPRTEEVDEASHAVETLPSAEDNARAAAD